MGSTRLPLNRLHQKIGSSPLILFFLGVLALGLWLAATVVQVQTSEYLALGNPTRVAGVAWGVLTQPWLLITGDVCLDRRTGDPRLRPGALRGRGQDQRGQSPPGQMVYHLRGRPDHLERLCRLFQQPRRESAGAIPDCPGHRRDRGGRSAAGCRLD